MSEQREERVKQRTALITIQRILLAGLVVLSSSLPVGAQTVTGQVEFASVHHLDFGVEGEVASLKAQVGDRVQQEALLLQLQQAPLQTARAAAEAEMAWKKALRDEAVRQWDRDNELYEEGSLSQVELEISDARKLRAESEYLHSVARHAASLNRLQLSRITAPVSGVVLAIHVHPGDRINRHNMLHPALVLGSEKTVVRTYLSPDDDHPRAGDAVTLVAMEHTISGRVISVVPTGDHSRLGMVVEGKGLPPVGRRVEIRY